MMSGWIHHKHKKQRPLVRSEIDERLDRTQRSPVLPDERANLLRMNSTYAEFIDNHFYDRGYLTALGAFFFPLLLLGPLWKTIPVLIEWSSARASNLEIFLAIYFTVVGLIASFLLWKLAIKRDICTYTHYPIRFNRKTRMIYAFRHNGPGGVLSVPWEKAFFFIARGQGGEKHLYELRCHVLDENGLVVDTFGLGHDDESRGGIMEVWEMIRLYMEEGPQAVPQYPVFLFPQKVKLKESWHTVATRIGGASMGMMIVTAPFWSIAVLMHYLALKTCKAPVWPPEIEEACKFDADDPYLLPEERYGKDIRVPARYGMPQTRCGIGTWRCCGIGSARNTPEALDELLHCPPGSTIAKKWVDYRLISIYMDFEKAACVQVRSNCIGRLFFSVSAVTGVIISAYMCSVSFQPEYSLSGCWYWHWPVYPRRQAARGPILRTLVLPG